MAKSKETTSKEAIISQKMIISLSALLGLFVSLVYFLMRMFDGTTLVQHSAGTFGMTLIYATIILVTLAFAPYIILARVYGLDAAELEEDERDLQILHSSDRIGYYTLTTIMTILLIHFVLMEKYPDSVFGDLAMTTPLHWVVFITVSMSLAEMVKWVSVIVMYRR